MKESLYNDGVRGRLIFAGLSELCEHGVADFSLRRVAAMAEVSCAAPYRHFKDKDELILAIISYVRESWDLLAEQIKSVYSTDPALCLVELSVAMVRFFIGNGGFRSLLVMALNESDSEKKDALREFETPIRMMLSVLSDEMGHSERERESMLFDVLSLLYGSLMLAGFNKINRDDILSSLREKLLRLIEKSRKIDFFAPNQLT